MDELTNDLTASALRFGYGHTKLGDVLVAVSPHGVAAILLGDDRPKLRHDLARAFPNCALIENQAAVSATIAQVTDLIDAPHTGFDLPLDLRGSRQQLAVWEALRAIPAGETRSYGEIAAVLSVPATAQEVGAACAANVLAVAVPCHRVVKADGSISGYRWGVQRKRRLINMEGVA